MPSWLTQWWSHLLVDILFLGPDDSQAQSRVLEQLHNCQWELLRGDGVQTKLCHTRIFVTRNAFLSQRNNFYHKKIKFPRRNEFQK